jgi:SpoVK/Ycf46/Vps4 family AAA+-type ATPase
MDQGFYVDIFERYYKRGLEAHKAGRGDEARRALLKAAEVLYKLAGAAPEGPLREARKSKAAGIVALAKSIDVAPGAAGTRGARSAAAEAGKPAVAGPAADEGGARWIIAERPDVSMADVAGLEEVKGVIRKRVIYPFQHPEVTRKYRKQAGGGVLLYGPPGTGKTMIAKAIANEVDATFFSVRCSDIMSKWVGEAEQNIKALFEAARQHPRVVAFLDETEAIVSRRGGGSTVMDRVIPEFLSQVDGVTGRHGGLLLLGATNRPWDMDDAALRPGRFGELVYIPLPDLPARRQMLAAALKGIPLAEEVDFDAAAAGTEGLSGADIVGLCERAKDAPYEREISTRLPQRLEVEDLQAAIAATRPSVTRSQLARYEKFRATGEA